MQIDDWQLEGINQKELPEIVEEISQFLNEESITVRQNLNAVIKKIENKSEAYLEKLDKNTNSYLYYLVFEQA